MGLSLCKAKGTDCSKFKKFVTKIQLDKTLVENIKFIV